MTFKVCNHGSKYSYLLHKMGFVDSQFGTTVLIQAQKVFSYPRFSVSLEVCSCFHSCLARGRDRVLTTPTIEAKANQYEEHMHLSLMSV